MSTPAGAGPIEHGETSLKYRGWRVVLFCFAMAMFSWCFGFYGQGVYLAELRRLTGWDTAVIALASTAYYLLSAALVVFVSDAIARLGPRLFLLGGIACFAVSSAALGWVHAVWQLYLDYLVMSFGWAAMGLATISTLIGAWFHERRGLAISLALNGASFAGMIGAPLLLFASDWLGFRSASLLAALLMVAVLLPMVLAWIDRGPLPLARAGAAAASSWTRGRALRSLPFWTVSAPFALALLAQVGFLVHLIALLTPRIGHPLAGAAVSMTAAAAVVGRLGLGFFIDRLDQRVASAGCFLSQSAALVVIAGAQDPATLLTCSVIFGLSVGNIITLPPLIIQREFEPAAFAMLVAFSTAIAQFTYSFGPGLLGLLRDVSGDYWLPVLTCAVLDALAAGLVLVRNWPLGKQAIRRA